MAASPGSPSYPLSPLGPKEEYFLDNFFKLLSHFAYDKAKELADKERDGHKAVFASSWGLFLYSLAQFAYAEKMYMSLAFLEQKSFFTRSKDNLKGIYQALSQEFKKVEENVHSQEQNVHFGMPYPTAEFEKLVAHLCKQLSDFTQARQKTMEFFLQVSTMGACKHINYPDLIIVMSEITLTHRGSFHHPLLSPLKTEFCYECEIVNHLLQSQKLMTEGQFLPSLLQQHQAHSKLISWGNNAIVKETKKSAFSSSSKQTNLPAVYNWLMKFKNLLVAKFSLYFCDILQKQTSVGEMKALTTKLSEDFVSRIIAFQKRSDATHVSLVLDTTGMSEPFKGAGYHFPTKYTEAPTGLDSYPAIFFYPNERPAHHWPNIVMMINNRTSDQSPHDKVSCFYDKTKQVTYFLTPVDARITFVAIFETKKSEKDNYVNNFILDLRSSLSCVKLFTALKPGAKV